MACQAEELQNIIGRLRLGGMDLAQNSRRADSRAAWPSEGSRDVTKLPWSAKEDRATRTEPRTPSAPSVDANGTSLVRTTKRLSINETRMKQGESVETNGKEVRILAVDDSKTMLAAPKSVCQQAGVAP